MPLTSKQRAELRAEAHHLRPIVQVGQGGIGGAIIASLEDALRTHELVKVQLARDSEVRPRETANQLAAAVQAGTASVTIRPIELRCSAFIQSA